MNVTKLQAALLNFAAADMRAARKYGSMMIANTKEGHVDVFYNAESRTYRIASCARFEKGQLIHGKALYDGTAAGAKITIANLYQVMS